MKKAEQMLLCPIFKIGKKPPQRLSDLLVYPFIDHTMPRVGDTKIKRPGPNLPWQAYNVVAEAQKILRNYQ